MTRRFVLKRSDDQFIFNFKAAGNSEIILTGERYTRKASALEGIAAIRENASAKTHYQRRTSHAGEPYFVLKAANAKCSARARCIRLVRLGGKLSDVLSRWMGLALIGEGPGLLIPAAMAAPPARRLPGPRERTEEPGRSWPGRLLAR